LFDSINVFLEKVTTGLLDSQQRIAIILHADMRADKLSCFINLLPFKKKLIISEIIQNGLPAEKASIKLGNEYDLVVFDVRQEFNADALGIISGALCGGGCLIVILSEKKIWDEQNSLFIKHVNELLYHQSAVYYFDDDVRHSAKDIVVNQFIKKPASVASPYLSYDQQFAVEGILAALETNSRYCSVLIAGRGRGKSSALGLISAQLLMQHNCKILLTAPRLSIADPLFYHLQQQCPDGLADRAGFKYKQSVLQFIAPDLLLDTLPSADVLLIDEAAAIPISMLQELLVHYPKIVFSTTTHGYEGTGRGFILKFYKLLDKSRPDWQKIELHQPVRWSKDDPLEKWLEELLFLNIKLDSRPTLPANKAECQIALINRAELLANKVKLSSVFSLLVFAHYRTRPSDFKYLLDSESIRIYTLEYRKQILGVVVINQEGGFDSELSTAIYRGERRPKGNLLAQTLCFHGGSEQAACLMYARVMRIVIHPDIHKYGFGSYLLNSVVQKEQAEGMDIIGSSFSATLPLLNFWNKADFTLLRTGFSRDHVSASYSIVVAKAFSEKGNKVVTELSLKFNRNISLWLAGPLLNLSEDIKQMVLIQNKHCTDKVSRLDMQDVESFARFNRNYDTCMPAIIRWLNSFDEYPEGLSDKELKVINLSMQFMNNWRAIVDEMKLSGKAEANLLLRSTLKHLLDIK